MKIILYNNHSENNKLDKTIVKIIELQGYLREQTSLLNPQIMIEFHPDQFEGYVKDDDQVYVIFNGVKITWDSFINNYVLSANYVYIPDFNRYYFINDIISVRQNLWRLILHVDVLMSYKKEISNTNAFVSRNEFKYNNMVKDDDITFYYDKDVEEYVLPKGDKVNTTFNTNIELIQNNIVISVINKYTGWEWNGSSVPDTDLPLVRSTTMGSGASYKIYAMWLVQLSHLCKAIQLDDTYADFILSCIAYPFVLETSGEEETLFLGDRAVIYNPSIENPQVVAVNNLTKEMPTYRIIADFTIEGTSFMDYEPYTQYELYLPYLSWIPVSADDILNNRIIVYYVIDYSTGVSQVCVYDLTNSKIIYSGSTQIGVKLGLTTTNQKEVNDVHTSNNISLGVGLLTSALSVVGGIATFNPVAIGGGLISGGATITKYAHNENTNYLHANGSVSSGVGGLFMCQDVKIKKTRLKPKNYNNDFAKLYGKPLNSYEKLGDLSGYTIVSGEHLENFGSSTKSETEEIKSLLSNGVIL